MANEKRLIDANEAVKLLRGKCVAKYPSTFLMGLLASASEVEQLPTVDAVEVVRCKDCRWWKNINSVNGCGLCKHSVFTFEDDTIDPMTEPDDFCSYGQRRE